MSLPNLYNPYESDNSGQFPTSPNPSTIFTPTVNSDQAHPIVNDVSAIQPHQRAFMEHVAAETTNRGDVEEYYQAAQNGIAPDVLDKQRVAQHAMDFAQQTANLSEQKYNELVDQIKTAQGNRPALPQQAPLQGPNIAQAALAAFGALTNPRHAYEIGATPFQFQLGEQARNTQQNFNDYALKQQEYNQNLEGLQTLARYAYQDMMNAREKAQKEGDKQAANLSQAIGRMLTANAEGEPTIAFQEAIDAGLPQEKIVQYAPLVQKREADLKAAFDDQRNKTAESIQTSNMRQERLQQTIDQAKALFPGKLELQKLGITHEGLANDLLQSRVDLIPQTKSLMESRVELAKKQLKWYDTNQATKQNLANYYAQLAWGNFQQRAQEFALSQDRFSYGAAKDAADRALDSLKAEEKSLRDDLKTSEGEKNRLLKQYGSEKAILALGDNDPDKLSYLAANGHVVKVNAALQTNLQRQASIAEPSPTRTQSIPGGPGGPPQIGVNPSTITGVQPKTGNPMQSNQNKPFDLTGTITPHGAKGSKSKSFTKTGSLPPGVH